ncbi:hypothetical protein A2154_02055 [Candidatus Gottesmanbacteria bacterium RBG_16_43_7]|uniref:Uncharacterized protein n=1 Tax=Candidatus Gottesmanbacteria bacterium RBG_16_43_7 TaxID=1798373 RepID=A0A1F5Z8D8_9BACT|nr:MAG: hypothetical protein A2154_02055 [Candidatus Gottesmanbacteria bacterium RBG_16_43_7]
MSVLFLLSRAYPGYSTGYKVAFFIQRFLSKKFSGDYRNQSFFCSILINIAKYSHFINYLAHQ